MKRINRMLKRGVFPYFVGYNSKKGEILKFNAQISDRLSEPKFPDDLSFVAEKIDPSRLIYFATLKGEISEKAVMASINNRLSGKEAEDAREAYRAYKKWTQENLELPTISTVSTLNLVPSIDIPAVPPCKFGL